jgi:4'-phosphopantetheinyl transferase
VINVSEVESISSYQGARCQTRWAFPPETVELSRDQVHLWKVWLTYAGLELHSLEQSLASDEQARADRFHFARDRRRFIAARGQMRMILASYVGASARALTFSYGARGKPFLRQPLEAEALKFNLSHSGELALLAVTRDRDIGVDLEEVHFLDDDESIAERFFSPRENAALRAVPQPERLEAFFSCWTLKEAYVKATGDGLARPTNSFDVFCEPGHSLGVEGDSQKVSRWSLVKLAPEPGYVGALAVEGQGWILDCF